MLKKLKKASAIALSCAMAIQFGLADSYYANTTTEQPVQEQEKQVTSANVTVKYVDTTGAALDQTTQDYEIGRVLTPKSFDGYTYESATVNGNAVSQVTIAQDTTTVQFTYAKVEQDNTEATVATQELTDEQQPVQDEQTNEEQQEQNNEETSEEEPNSEEEKENKQEEESQPEEKKNEISTQEAKVQLTEFFVIADKNQVTKGDTAQMTLTIKPDNYPNKDVTWTSSNEDVATVDQSGKVTTKEVGTAKITATLNDDTTVTSSTTIVVNPVKISKVEISGYTKEYLIVNDTVTLKATATPEDAANKSIIWSSSNEDIATVDQNGKVTAKEKGTVSIFATNEDSGVYGEQKITIYDQKPATATVNVWVTNLNQKISYTINIPKDGTVVTPAQLAQNTKDSENTYITNAEFRVIPTNQMSGQPNWTNLQRNYSLVTGFRYSNGRIQYTTGNGWTNVGNNGIYDFSSIKYQPQESGSVKDQNTGINVIVGDWPFKKGESTDNTKQTIQIQVKNSDQNNQIEYDTGKMRYSNGSNSDLGQIKFNCNEAKYEVTKVEIYYSSTGSEKLQTTYTKGNIPNSISCKFNNGGTNHYRVVAYVTAKTINVKYNANGGNGVPEDSTVKATGKVTVDSTTRPTRDGYIFTGWAYDGMIYQGGEQFDAPINDVTFVAQWVKASDAINYVVNDAAMGSVSRSYERIGETVQGDVQGSTAIAKTGYQFVKWVKGTDPKANAVSTDVEYKPTEKGTYMAVFEAVTSNLIVCYVDEQGNELADSETKAYKYGTEYSVSAKDITGYKLISKSTITGTKGVGEETVTFVYKAINVVVTITGNHDEVTYDGNKHTVEGYKVTITDDSGNKASGYTENDFNLKDNLENVRTTITETNAGTYYMGLNEDCFENKNSNFKNVTFKVSDGYLTIKPNNKLINVTITGASNSVTYNGSEQSVTGFITDLDKEYSGQIEISLKDGVNATARGTDAGIYNMRLTSESFNITSNNYSNISIISVIDGQLTITPKEYTVTTKSDSKVYDGKPLTAEGRVNGLVGDETVGFTVTGSQTKVGHSKNTYELNWTGSAKESNYTHGKDSIGILTVSEQSIDPGEDPDNPNPNYRGIQIDSPSSSVYDGKEHKWVPTVTDKEGIALNAENYEVSYDTTDFIDVKTITVTITGKGNYTGTVTRTYQITPAPLTIKTEGKSKTYDGHALTAGGTISGLVNGETVDFKTTGSQTKVGHSANTYELNWTGTAKKSNYEITSKEIGQLVVNELADQITVTTTGGTFTYDGHSHEATVSVSELPEGYTLETATSSATATDVTSKDVVATCDELVIRNAEGEDVTSKLKIKKVDGKIKITPATLTIATPNASKTYDGDALTAEGTISELANGETVDFKTTGSQTKVGHSKNTYELKWNGTAKESNYTISEKIGTLTVSEQSIDPGTPEKPNPSYKGVTINSPENKTYNGQDQTWSPEVKDAAGNPLTKGTDYTVSYDKENRTDVTGTITVTITGKGNYTGTVTRTYQITKRSVQLSSATASKTYDGKALTRPNVTVDDDGFVEGEVSDLKATGTITNVGSVTNTITYTKGEKFKDDNYVIKKHEGTLTVVKQSIVPDPENPETYDGIQISDPSDVEYDGADHKWAPTVTDKDGNELNENEAYEVSYDTTDFRDVKTITVTIKGIENYTGTVTKSYKITPRKYTITTYGGTKVFDGKALTNFGRVEGIVPGETYSFKTTGSQTAVGSSDNTYEFKFDGSAKSKNYVLDKETIGKLVVTPKSIIPDTPDTPDSDKTGITVSDPSDSKYDGKEHREVLTVKDSKTGKELVSGTDYAVVYSSDVVNAGTVTITVTGKGNYEGTFKKTYKITAREITLTSASDSKTYDGSALTNDSIKVSGDGFVEGEGATYEVTGSQTEVGNSANAFEYSLNKNTLASNYKITKVVGTLTVTRNQTPTTPTTPTTPSTPSTPGTTTPAIPRIIQRIVNVINPTPSQTPSENVENNKTPKAQRETETVEEDYTPKATRKYYWALINLICAILTVLFGLLLLISKRHKDDDDDEDEDDETQEAAREEDEEEEKEAKKRGLFTRVLAVLIAILSVVLFVFTEDMSLPWTWVDKWTVWMVVIGLVQILVFFVGRKWKKDDDDDEEDEEQAEQA